MQIFDPANNRYIWSPPSGNIASIYAYSDQVSEVWFAPAGFNRGIVQQVQKLEFSCSFGDRENMYGNGNAVNPVVNFTQDGIVVYGQRTLQRDPTALDRVNVRRLMLYTRKVVTTAVKYLLWEPNDSTTWRQFVAMVDPYLASVVSLRGITDYEIICDETTNTPQLINNNQMAANIYINPTRAVEQILINAILTPDGVAFSEIVF
jgi:phage tail sheath protein FI